MTPEQIAAMVADRESGTPGPWMYRPGQYDDWGVVKAGGCVICQARDPERLDGSILAEYRKKGTDPWEANARRFARVPEMEAAIQSQAAEIARLTAERDDALARAEKAEAENARLRSALHFYADFYEYPDDGPWGCNSTDFGTLARAALGEAQ